MPNTAPPVIPRQHEYRQKLCTPAEAASIVKSGDHLCFPIGVGEPTLFVKALAARKRELDGVIVNQQHHLCPDYFTRSRLRRTSG